MLVIRLSRHGRKGKPFYHVVAADSKNPRNGSFKEKIGYYNPIANRVAEKVISIDMDRFNYWVSVGAQVRERVENLVKTQAKMNQAKTSPEPNNKSSEKKKA
ncbi:MAG: 30S ribosomal protein S16 [Pseudomonadota bacterium]|nr:30S ribosomal protein S16 [Pseudomonadota bacterium]